jgi:hypothetical protein
VIHRRAQAKHRQNTQAELQPFTPLVRWIAAVMLVRQIDEIRQHTYSKCQRDSEIYLAHVLIHYFFTS